MKPEIIFLLALALPGCASVAEYSVKPIKSTDGTVTCCELSVKNNKDVDKLRAVIRKSGDDFYVELEEHGVKASSSTDAVSNAFGSFFGVK